MFLILAEVAFLARVAKARSGNLKQSVRAGVVGSLFILRFVPKVSETPLATPFQCHVWHSSGHKLHRNGGVNAWLTKCAVFLLSPLPSPQSNNARNKDERIPSGVDGKDGHLQRKP